MDRFKLRDLMTILRDRQGITFAQLVDQVNTQAMVNLDYGAFVRKYLREARLSKATQHDSKEIEEIIKAFVMLGGVEKCHSFDALLFCEWAGVGLTTFRKLNYLYSDHQMKKATELAFKFDLTTLDYNNPEIINEIRQYLGYDDDDADVNVHQAQFTQGPSQGGSYKLGLPIDIDFATAIKHHMLIIHDYDDKRDVRRVLPRIKQLIWKGHLLAAEDIIDQVREDAERSDYYRAEILHYLGVIRTNQDRYVEAEQLLQEARGFAGETKIVPILANLGANAHYAGDYEKATCFLKEAQGATPTELESVFILTTLGNLVHERHDYANAKLLYWQALQQTRKMKIDQGDREAFLHLNLGILNYDEEMFQQADHEYQIALRLVDPTLNPLLYTQLWWNISLLTAINKDFVRAVAQMQRAQNLAKSVGLVGFELGIMLDLAKLYLAWSHVELAATLFDEVFIAASKLRNRKQVAQAVYGVILCIVVRKNASTNSITALSDMLYKELSFNYQEELRNLYYEANLSHGVTFMKSGVGKWINVPLPIIEQAILRLIKQRLL